ncbi:hypothetical protein C8R47DRAFT_1224810 [Mycena vitilis]|nr:hypothetical protein C8R47DRAFT_1224802 [Mycena vitilis]KAJ6464290.1 hypothetical protein C8R47DRAFT_1224806 [Mycena vitilis]KAJ6464293.1 hypothetical protein C8R47DRAFT_1224810 [Mycena vitilis]
MSSLLRAEATLRRTHSFETMCCAPASNVAHLRQTVATPATRRAFVLSHVQLVTEAPRSGAHSFKTTYRPPASDLTYLRWVYFFTLSMLATEAPRGGADSSETTHRVPASGVPTLILAPAGKMPPSCAMSRLRALLYAARQALTLYIAFPRPGLRCRKFAAGRQTSPRHEFIRPRAVKIVFSRLPPPTRHHQTRRAASQCGYLLIPRFLEFPRATQQGGYLRPFLELAPTTQRFKTGFFGVPRPTFAHRSRHAASDGGYKFISTFFDVPRAT